MSVQFDRDILIAAVQTRTGHLRIEIQNHAGALSRGVAEEWATSTAIDFIDLYCASECGWSVSAWSGAYRIGFFRFNLDGPALICRGLFVEPERRQRGVALAMLSAAIEWFGATAVRGIASGLPDELVAALRAAHPGLVVVGGSEAAL